MAYTVVIDPGHGGDEFHGGEFGPYIEKDIDLIVSNVIKSRLEEYDDVNVYLTRTGDYPVDLKQRCDIAKAYNADLFVSVHFNLSSLHNLYGSEVFLPIQKSYYQKLYPLGTYLMENFDNMGIYNRGIKTRVGKNGDNYYAVIKYAANYGIPGCIIEHCHMDNPKDNIFLPIGNPVSYQNSLINFGINDAEAIAKYLKLKSSKLGVDYSNLKGAEPSKLSGKVLPDESAPEINEIKVASFDPTNGNLVLNMKAVDKQSYILYYQYSFDGGYSFSALLPWPRNTWNCSQDEYTVTLNAPVNRNLNVVTRVYNSFDVTKDSNVISILSGTKIANASVMLPQNDEAATQNIIVSMLDRGKPSDSFSYTNNFTLDIVFAFVLIGFGIRLLLKHIFKNDKTR